VTAWIYLTTAILFEVAGTTFMKLSQGLSQLGYAALMFGCYALSFTSLTLALRGIDLSVAYAIWAGLGTALIAAIGVAAFAEPMTPLKVASLALVILGVVGLNLTRAH
jgi:small multidrug resistance pump